MSIFSKIAVTDEERAAKAKEVMKAIASFSKQRNIDPEKALLLAGGSMYFRGLKDEMNDIDFPHPGLKDFTKQTIGKYELDGGPGGMPADAYASDKVYGLNVQKPEAILAFYKFLNRPKDQQKIQLLNSLLNPNATDETTKSASAPGNVLVKVKPASTAKSLLHHYLKAQEWGYPAGKQEPGQELEDHP